MSTQVRQLVGWSVGRWDGLLGGRRSVIISKKTLEATTIGVLVWSVNTNIGLKHVETYVWYTSFFCNGESGATHELLMHLAVLKWAKNV